MRRLLAILVIGILLLNGCTQQKPPPVNVTNESNYTAPPPPPSNQTVNVTIPPGYEVSDYCVQDSDCIRQKKCCDCGPGEYVNFYHLENPVCAPPQCACPIMRTTGACQDNKCVAVPYNESGADIFYFWTNNSGKCGNGQVLPSKIISNVGTTVNGTIQAPNPCYTAEANLGNSANGTYAINISLKPLATFAACVQCVGEIQWFADIRGYNGSIEVYYDGAKVYSDIDRFCGWSSGPCNIDQDCMTSGCFQEVCQSRRDPKTDTNCDDTRACYDSGKYGFACGCQSSKCMWRKR